MRCQEYKVKHVYDASVFPEEAKTNCGDACHNQTDQCLVPWDSEQKSICAEKSAVRVIVPYERGILKKYKQGQQMGYYGGNLEE